MARSAQRSNQGSAPRSLQYGVGPSPSFVLQATALILLALTAGLVFAMSSELRTWTYEALRYGWVPVAGWAVAALVVLRYRQAFLGTYWRWWILTAAATAIAVGALSLLRVSDGVFSETGMSGRWGEVIGGTPLAVALGKLAAIVLITPLLLYPRSVGTAYLLVTRYTASGLRVVLVHVYGGMYRGYRFMDQKVLPSIGSYLRWQGQQTAKLFRSIPRPAKRPSELQDRSAHDGDPSAPIFTLPDTGSEALFHGLQPNGLLLNELSPNVLSDEAVPSETFRPDVAGAAAHNGKASGWRLPSPKTLSPAEPPAGANKALEQMARHVEQSLSDHGVSVEVKDIKAGPRIVRFGLVPGWNAKKTDVTKTEDGEGKGERSRVKVQSILMREKDLALALQTPFLRIEAPVPGEALVGLEVPTPSPTKVHIRGVIETPTFDTVAAKRGLPVALGQDTGGTPVVTDLTTLPHMLIAGATGSGKSVCINSIVASLLLTKRPDELRMLMVDPKRVELTPFAGIPHLIMPVIVEVDEVNPALRGLMREMLRRYKQMEVLGTRNITSYNKKAEEPMPYLLLIVDELADLMMTGGFEIEQNLVRLAQLGRATGIHLVLATQRPSVNVVTGLLKANVPARCAFAVASQVDSRVILDAVGAEKLLGQGDMLLLHKESPKPQRVQGTLVYDEEIDSLVKHWVNESGPPLPVIHMADEAADDSNGDDSDDPLLDQAREMALRNPHVSQSFLERQLKVGGGRSTQIMKLLEEEGVLSPR